MTITHFPIADHAQRERALDPTQSFIVQAPAGSGKTELLTQRILVLLQTVNQPEDILAVTFTKKSASEMRERIIKALQIANCSAEPKAQHAQKTWHLAKAVLNRNDYLQWHLLDNPNRLHIQTIDSFNTSIIKRYPISSSIGSTIEMSDHPKTLYVEAITNLLSYLEKNEPISDYLEILLLHLDNNIENITTLLTTMLEKRDQWMPYLSPDQNDLLVREQLEEQLAIVITDHLHNLFNLISTNESQELITLARFAASNLIKDNPSSPIKPCLDWLELPLTPESLPTWKALADLLLTKEGSWRKSFDKRIGFPSPSDVKNSAEKMVFHDMKKRITQLVQQFCNNEKLQIALSELTILPDPLYQNAQWEVLNALQHILQHAVAALKQVFKKQGKIDFVENAQAALKALRDASDRYAISHILIDEFQDTSSSQYQLVERLIQDWKPDDGRTLFVVGDPMQSIYRFREAEVGLFIRARQHGIGHLPLEPLTLCVNFRSTDPMVNWINDHFKTVFPSFEDITTGAVSYSASMTHQKECNKKNAVFLHACQEDNEKNATQTHQIINLIRDTKKNNPKGTIAILVRSRHHLNEIIPALKKANLSYRAINIDRLTTRPVIQDLMALTRALLYPADRIAWLAVLRAPWCGLTLSDLLMIAGKKEHHIIWQQLESSTALNQLSPDGKNRFLRIYPILQAKLKERYCYSLRQWIENTWQELGGPACIDQPGDLLDADAYFALLAKFENHTPSLTDLENNVNQLFATPDPSADSTLQIMTIHNSKGLEFDTVILPHLDRESTADKNQLLLWMQNPRPHHQSTMILAPVQAVGEKKNAIYHYIKAQHAIKSDYENSRLFYVAATRAKKELHLFFTIQQNKEPRKNSLLHKLWPSIRHHIEHNTPIPAEADIISLSAEPFGLTELPSSKKIKRFALDWISPVQNHHALQSHSNNALRFILKDETSRYIGILIHQILQYLAILGKNWWDSQCSQEQDLYIKTHLQQLGTAEDRILDAINIVQYAISNTLQDTRGQWILHAHPKHETELPLTALIHGHIESLIIDRTFIDESGVRWIIDYKSSINKEEDPLDEFLKKEKMQYKNQLWSYYQALQQLDNRPIRIGLYFPLLSAWQEWSFDTFTRKNLPSKAQQD